MKKYLFDVKMWASVHVTASSEKEARAKMRDQLGELTINHEKDGLAIYGISAETPGDDPLIEIDGEAV